MVSELESSFQLLEDQVSFSAGVLQTDQSHDHMLPLLKFYTTVIVITWF